MKKLWELLKMGFKSLFIAPVLDYESANSIAKFGIILDDKAKFKKAITHINSLINFKADSKDKSLVIEITDSQHDYRSILPLLKQYYSDLRFIVEEIEIMREQYLFISWKDK